MTIFSIGYQGDMSPSRLAGILEQLEADLVDVRSRPSGRVKRGFARRDLEALLGGRYTWRGDTLGGMGAGVRPEGLDWLVERSAAAALAGRAVAIMCAEEAPGECHRHHQIALPLLERGVVVRHVYRGEVIDADELQRAIDEGDDYVCEELSA